MINLTALTSQPLVPILAVCVLGATLGAVWYHGYNHRDKDFQRYKADVAIQQSLHEGRTELLREQTRRVSSEIIAEYEQKTLSLYKENSQLKEKLKKEYITDEDDKACPPSAAIPRKLNRVFEQAITGRDPSPSLPSSTSRSEQAPPSPLLSDVARLQVDNLTMYREVMLEAEAWREWYKEQEAIWGAASVAASRGKKGKP